MAYTTEAAVRSATGMTNTSNITSSKVTTYIADADSVIDSYIADIYTLPLSTTPEVIETISRNIASALLFADNYGEESQDTDKGWERRMNFYTTQLEKIQKQKIKLRDSSGNELARSSLMIPTFRPTEALSEEGESDEARLTFDKKF